MCKSIPGTRKHLTTDQRITVEKASDQGYPFLSIALQLGKDPTTISKEFKKHRFLHDPSESSGNPILRKDSLQLH